MSSSSETFPMGSELPIDSPVSRKRDKPAPVLEWEAKPPKVPKAKKQRTADKPKGKANRATLKLTKEFVDRMDLYFPDGRVLTGRALDEVIEPLVEWFNASRFFLSLVHGLPLHADIVQLASLEEGGVNANHANIRTVHGIHALCVVARAKIQIWHDEK